MPSNVKQKQVLLVLQNLSFNLNEIASFKKFEIIIVIHLFTNMLRARSNIQNRWYCYSKIPGCSLRFKSVFSEDYQFLQRSVVPTLHFQKSLPRLPIPEISKTASRYLEAQRALLSDHSYQQTEKHVQSFLNNEGPSLQKELQEFDKQNKHTSYISKPWFDMYLTDRTPLPINYNPCLIFVNHGKEFYDKQLYKTANLLISSLRFYKSLKENILEPEVFHLKPKKSDTYFFRRFTSLLPSSVSWYGAYLMKAYPLDMSQYSSLFNNTRIPEIGKDRLYHAEDRRHVVVLRNGHFYTFDVIDEFGNISSPSTILSCLKYILDDQVEAAEHPIGVLTTGERNKWAETRKHLDKIGNTKVLEEIDSALFAIALDTVVVEKPKDIIRWFLHSDGKNRWFDKSFTLITTANGFAGLNFEHSWGDGVAVLRYFTDIFNDSTWRPRVTPDTTVAPILDSEVPKRLNFTIDEKIKADIAETKKSFDVICRSLEIRDVIHNLGREQCKDHKVSADAVMQLIFQLAYYYLDGNTVPTYESCSTAAFRHGRTETVRPCTLETLEFCKAVGSVGVGDDVLREMVRKCSDKHSELVKNAAMGQGFDRHLFALRKLAENNSSSLPAIFTDPNYENINRNILSTSTLSSDLVLGGGFGPVVSNGYGIAYMIRKDTCGTVVTNYKNHTNGGGFSECLVNSMKTLERILTTK